MRLTTLRLRYWMAQVIAPRGATVLPSIGHEWAWPELPYDPSDPDAADRWLDQQERDRAAQRTTGS